jgi:hypothetical protein
MGIVGAYPAVFVPQNRPGCKIRIRVARHGGQASKGVTGCGTWKNAQPIENKGFTKRLFARRGGLRAERVQVRV